MLVKNELFICETLASCRKREWPFMHLENRELSIYVSFASWHVRILLRNTLRMEKALDKHWYWYWYFGSSLLNTDFISTFHSAFFLTKSPFPSFQGYLQKTVVISFCTLELTPPILYSPIVFMPARQRKKRKFRNRNEEQRFFCQVKNKLRHGPPMNEAHCYS